MESFSLIITIVETFAPMFLDRVHQQMNSLVLEGRGRHDVKTFVSKQDFELLNHLLCARKIRLVDCQHVSDFREPSLHSLNLIAHPGNQYNHNRMGQSGDLHLVLSDSYGLNEDHLFSRRIEEMDGFSNGNREAAAASTGSKASDKDAVVEKMFAHSNAVSQNGAARENATGVHCQDSHRLFPSPKFNSHPVNESALSRPWRTGHTDNVSSACMRIERFKSDLGLVISIFDQAHKPSERANIAVKNLL